MGLLREMSNPLGFYAGSSAFTELTGFSLDRSNLARPPGFLWLPPWGPTGLFVECQGEAGAMAGAFLNAVLVPGWRMETALCFVEQASSKFGDTWYREDAPTPGGSLVLAAGRLRAVFPSLQVSATLGGSMGEVLLPGWFVHLQGWARAGPVEAALLFGGSGGDYRVPSGEAPGAAWRFSGRAQVSTRESVAEIVYTVDVAGPGFAPRPFLAERQEVRLAFTRELGAGIRLEGRKIITTSAWGEVREEAGCSGTLSAAFRGTRASASMGWSWEAGPSAGVELSVAPTEDVRLKLHAAWSSREGEITLDASWKIRAGGSAGR